MYARICKYLGISSEYFINSIITTSCVFSPNKIYSTEVIISNGEFIRLPGSLLHGHKIIMGTTNLSKSHAEVYPGGFCGGILTNLGWVIIQHNQMLVTGELKGYTPDDILEEIPREFIIGCFNSYPHGKIPEEIVMLSFNGHSKFHNKTICLPRAALVRHCDRRYRSKSRIQIPYDALNDQDVFLIKYTLCVDKYNKLKKSKEYYNVMGYLGTSSKY